MGSKEQKLRERFKSIPADFEWSEMKRLLEGFGYRQAEASGSRVKFVGEELPRILLHKPHPKKIMNRSTLRDVKTLLMEANLI